VLVRVDAAALRSRLLKAQAHIFEQACSTLGGTTSDAVYLGDAYEIDAVGARRAGLRGICSIARGAESRTMIPPIIHSLSDLPGCLDESPDAFHLALYGMPC
jgi:FMN phosphatase YigB (HAD superfamily)